jgi:hypothetical protein
MFIGCLIQFVIQIDFPKFFLVFEVNIDRTEMHWLILLIDNVEQEIRKRQGFFSK